MNFDLSQITVKIKIIEERKLKAIISIDLGIGVIVKGFRVSESEYANDRGDKLWLTPPSYRDGGGRFHPIFFMPDKEQWKRLEDKVWEEYSKALTKHYQKRLDISDEDIPIINS